LARRHHRHAGTHRPARIFLRPYLARRHHRHAGRSAREIACYIPRRHVADESAARRAPKYRALFSAGAHALVASALEHVALIVRRPARTASEHAAQNIDPAANHVRAGIENPFRDLAEVRILRHYRLRLRLIEAM
jgi:hypothetical protein